MIILLNVFGPAILIDGFANLDIFQFVLSTPWVLVSPGMIINDDNSSQSNFNFEMKLSRKLQPKVMFSSKGKT